LERTNSPISSNNARRSSDHAYESLPRACADWPERGRRIWLFPVRGRDSQSYSVPSALLRRPRLFDTASMMIAGARVGITFANANRTPRRAHDTRRSGRRRVPMTHFRRYWREPFRCQQLCPPGEHRSGNDRLALPGLPLRPRSGRRPASINTQMTREIAEVAHTLGITVHDHLLRVRPSTKSVASPVGATPMGCFPAMAASLQRFLIARKTPRGTLPPRTPAIGVILAPR
jgi:hypothetical protein